MCVSKHTHIATVLPDQDACLEKLFLCVTKLGTGYNGSSLLCLVCSEWRHVGQSFLRGDLSVSMKPDTHKKLYLYLKKLFLYVSKRNLKFSGLGLLCTVCSEGEHNPRDGVICNYGA